MSQTHVGYLLKLKQGELYIGLRNGQTEILVKSGGSQSNSSVGTGDWLETPKAIEAENQVVVRIVSQKGSYRADVVGTSVRLYLGTAPEGKELELTPIDSFPSQPAFPFEDL